MPVRKIPKTYRSISGRFPSAINGRCIGYESKLERDYYLRLEFDQTIASYEEQPIRLSGSVDGKEVSYTPDCLVKFLDGKPPRIVEVKSQEELDKKAEDLERRFSLARNHVEGQGGEFVIINEKDIYDDALANYRLIYRFVKPPPNIETKRKLIIGILEHAGPLPLRDLLKSLGEDRIAQAHFTRAIWHMLYTREIEADLSKPISHSTILRISNGTENLS
ncbi:TnsA endonuclease [Geobacter metallireducens RCH3]|uniref:Endonuclease, TnsA family n=1 Tax=Geobacter metallireducens (strain ATCC 53774 / DSM 7210 / GS-15) TaxID=269799 RepID=Q39R63_GEOMG|nr:heteromeric transposase endonuclease subunit TnsA [Geobacter metallireducens]ABB33261.1 endonuclease, TnsA family [Geobacter metallireducens GS-15]EHP85839.1 TnsA endonuclease [Geobacter metallireducens RCH3]